MLDAISADIRSRSVVAAVAIHPMSSNRTAPKALSAGVFQLPLMAITLVSNEFVPSRPQTEKAATLQPRADVCTRRKRAAEPVAAGLLTLGVAPARTIQPS